MNLRTVCGNIKEREIVLYGNEEEIYSFLQTYQKTLNIKIVITDHKKEVKLQAYDSYGVKTVLVDEVLWTNELIVICDKTWFGRLQKRLEHIGKTEYQDYISQEIVDALIQQKKLMVCMGTQLIEQTCLFLEQGSCTTEHYSMIFYDESKIREGYMNRWPEYLHVSRWCDVYFHSSCEKERYPLKILDKKMLSPNCLVISVSDYGFGGYFPQIVRDRDQISDFLLREWERFDISYETLAFSRADKEMESLCRKNTDMELIVKKVLDENFYSVQNVEEYFASEVKRFKEMEKEDDIKLGDFIWEHKTKCLCRNLNEWNEPVISYVSNAVLHILGLDELRVDISERENLIESNSGSEILIYPSVHKALNLEGSLDAKKYKVVTYRSIKSMSEEEYAKFLIAYLSRAWDIIRFTGSDEELQSNYLLN